ncbi:TetR/AcrR family transcriptional regulator [Arthrobacter sp. 35W]|uniref:TetR/AcrR family transcriptional regulator n=1 Tax=Arthrobacter sp. 35W TaxID=1132441 RepID=UPI00047A6816|nr:TetR family transcriptional regulator [Arthrobacter sp. 35W]
MENSKSAQTRELVLQTALGMFRSRGFAKTTMRGIAAEAGVSLGSAYYYFASKDELILELYRESVAEQRVRASEAMAGVVPLADRLRAAMDAGIDALTPYHAFGSGFLGSALPPSSAVNPFGEASAEIRLEAEAIFAEAIEGAKVPANLRSDLPQLLWLGYMGVVLFWVYDRSQGQWRTRTLINGAAPLIARTLSLARLPVARGLVEDALTLMAKVRP